MKYKATLIKSPLGYSYKTRLTTKALGLKKMHSSIEVDSNDKVIMGMINKVKHVIKLQEYK